MKQETTQQPVQEPPNLAEAIIKISDAAAALRKSGLNQRAIIVLLRDSSGVGMKDIEYVLNHLAILKSRYTTLK